MGWWNASGEVVATEGSYLSRPELPSHSATTRRARRSIVAHYEHVIHPLRPDHLAGRPWFGRWFFPANRGGWPVEVYRPPYEALAARLPIHPGGATAQGKIRAAIRQAVGRERFFSGQHVTLARGITGVDYYMSDVPALSASRPNLIRSANTALSPRPVRGGRAIQLYTPPDVTARMRADLNTDPVAAPPEGAVMASVIPSDARLKQSFAERPLDPFATADGQRASVAAPASPSAPGGTVFLLIMGVLGYLALTRLK